MKHHHYIALCFFSLLMAVGSVGALEIGNIGSGQALAQIVLFFVLAFLFKMKSNKKAPREADTSTEHKGKNTTYILHDKPGGVKR